jgi:hypothetical protein
MAFKMKVPFLITYKMKGGVLCDAHGKPVGPTNPNRCNPYDHPPGPNNPCTDKSNQTGIDEIAKNWRGGGLFKYKKKRSCGCK